MLSILRTAIDAVSDVLGCIQDYSDQHMSLTSAHAGRNNSVAERSYGHRLHCLRRRSVLMLCTLLHACFLLSCFQNAPKILSRVASLCQASEEPAAPILVGSSAPAGIDLAMRDRAKVKPRPHCRDLEFDDVLGSTQPSSQGDRLMRLG